MKEQRFFYTPEVETGELPEEEAGHAVRVLRLGEGDEIWLMDGRGTFYRAEITEATKKHCFYDIKETLPQEKTWKGYRHLAVAPTKNLDRMEWLAEKATEVGIDELTFLDCRLSERHQVKNERIEKIIISAMKQSRKAWLPRFNGVVRFDDFLSSVGSGISTLHPYICHCHEGEKPLLREELGNSETPNVQDVLVMIGPEGDFSLEEVRAAEALGAKAVSLGESRLRTETAALVATVIVATL